jgi:cyclopropane-fatty-acyl-phospholipid synthase
MRLQERLFVRMLKGLRGGRIELTLPSGAHAVIGCGGAFPIEMTIGRASFFKKVISAGSVGFGESYVDGDWDTPQLSKLLGLFARNQNDLGRIGRGFSLVARQMNRFYHKARRNSLEQSKANIQEHYDLSNDFYATFLDASMTYSSACFENDEQDLEAAQMTKIDRMLDLAGVGEGSTILEIGSGWGALALRAARRGCRVKTITLSEAQYGYARELFEHAGVGDHVEIALEDYRLQRGTYDAVLSCEMIEAVGREYLASYFEVISRSLKSGGKAVIQAITIPDERYEAYSRRCDWIQKHIFPGGHLPSPGAIRQHVEAAGRTSVSAMQSFGHDYAETLRRWAGAFNAAESKVRAIGFDPTFQRKWNYYLSYCEAGFDAGLIDVQHVLIERS